MVKIFMCGRFKKGLILAVAFLAILTPTVFSPGVSGAGEKTPANPFFIAIPLFLQGRSMQNSTEMLAELVVFNFFTDSGSYRVVGQKEIESAIPEKYKHAVRNCSGNSDVFSIGAAMGADFAITWSAEGLGPLVFRVFDIPKRKMLCSRSELIQGNNEKKVDTISRMLKDVLSDLKKSVIEPVTVEVVPPAAGIPKPKPAVTAVAAPTPVQPPVAKPAPVKKDLKQLSQAATPSNPYKIAGHATFWPGIALLAAGGGMTGMYYYYRNQYIDDHNEETWQEAELGGRLAISFYVIGGAAVFTGIMLWALGPSDKEFAEKHKISATPIFENGNLGIGFSGEW